MYHKRRRAGFKRLQREFRIRCPLTERIQLLSSSGGAKRPPPVCLPGAELPAFKLSDSRKRFERRTKAHHGRRRRSTVRAVATKRRTSRASSTGIGIIHPAHAIAGLGADHKIPDRRSDD